MKVLRAAVVTLLDLAAVIIVVDEIVRSSRLRQVSDGAAERRIYTYLYHAVVKSKDGGLQGRELACHQKGGVQEPACKCRETRHQFSG